MITQKDIDEITQKDIDEIDKKYNKWGLVWTDNTSEIDFSNEEDYSVFVQFDPMSLIKQSDIDNEYEK